MVYHEGALDESGEHEPTSVCDSQRAYNFTTLYAARKFMRAVKHRRQRNENIQETTGFFNRSESVSPTNIPFSSSPLTHALSQSDSQRRLLPSGLSNHYMSTDDDKSESENATGLEDDEHAPLSLWQDFIVLKNIIASNGLHLLLLVIPVAVLSDELKWKASLTFLLSSLAVIPLASLLAEFTEELATHLNQCVAGIINASFGNAVEVIVALQALRADQIRIVQASLIGSIFSNMLLVLGCCFFFGGLRFKEQYFNTTSALANMSMLLLSGIALLLTTPVAASAGGLDETLFVSRVSGGFLLFMYIQLLIFQLGTHAHIFDEDNGASLPKLTLSTSLIMLLGITMSVAFLSDILVGSIDGFITEANISTAFVGIVIIPIIGNAVEHVIAVSVAVKGKMDLAIGVAVGSATQISMFVVPVCLIAGWIWDKDMTLLFPLNEVSLYIMSVVVVGFVTSSGTSNWLMGSLLISSYLLVCLAFWCEQSKSE